MNARYYLPEIGRFISADTIVPNPANPQSYNRYAYANNSPVNFTDPTGHCINNYEVGSEEMETCLAGWSALYNFLMGAAYGPGGSGHFPNETVTDWLLNADIGTLENLMEVMGIDYGYTWTPPQGYTAPGWRGGRDLKGPEARAEVCDYWQSCYQPATDYIVMAFRLPGPLSGKVILDNFGNLYIGLQRSSTPGYSLFLGDANVTRGRYRIDISEFPPEQRESILENALTGVSIGITGGWKGVGGSISDNPNGDTFYEVGVASRGLSVDISYMWLIYDAGNSSP
jgi:hypothetical protein